jgi:hypothetical protein
MSNLKDFTFSFARSFYRFLSAKWWKILQVNLNLIRIVILRQA